MRYILGVDAGNTKTIALVAQSDGRLVGAGRGGGGDIYGAPSAEEAIKQVEEAVYAALASAGAGPSELVASCFSMAGADWPEDFVFLQTTLEQQGFGRSVMVVNDAIGALRAGSPDGCGVVVVCGTGAAIGARAPDGRIWHSSFWQEPQGGRELGRIALRAVYRAELGVDPPTSLTKRVLSFFEQPSVEDLLHLLTLRQGRRQPGLDGLARVLLDEAAAGDLTARQLVQAHGTALGDYALVAARRVGIADTLFTLVLAGGVLRHASPLLRDAIVDRVCAASPGACPIMSRFEPAVGALLLAIESACVAVDEQLLARIELSLPARELFAT